ncbi:class I SAM-dependent methyltransferase [Kitasatospora sp. GAS204B]|uniref:class I SAM-dependent methyltransferase n=1 Tax=unclassified Kitasatospora TaxID=2633591 RepID=UPI0024752CD8|nr:class I SAM-dependent methyltransferase [Kitasatospora sp. GAS204B]MDH6120369.1 SAM-dependent methyltransferase [Kitasatospora sp. GAS204B]
MTEPAYLAAVRDSYDEVAVDYARGVMKPAEFAPLSRAMLAAFAELVLAAGAGPVADLGCGPGHLTAHLARAGLSAFGVDLSPRMIELARQAYPELRFELGSMTALELGDDELGGILAHFSTHHTPPEALPAVFAECYRVLAPGGHLMLAGHVGDGEQLSPTRAYGDHPVSYAWYLLPAPRIAELLDQAGFVRTAQLVQQPGEGVKRASVTLLVRKPFGEPGPGRLTAR